MLIRLCVYHALPWRNDLLWESYEACTTVLLVTLYSVLPAGTLGSAILGFYGRSNVARPIKPELVITEIHSSQV